MLVEQILISKSRYLVVVQTEKEYFFLACKDDPTELLKLESKEFNLKEYGKILGHGYGFPAPYMIEHFKKECGDIG